MAVDLFREHVSRIDYGCHFHLLNRLGNLRASESLNLSTNSRSGEIAQEPIRLDFLAIFDVFDDDHMD